MVKLPYVSARMNFIPGPRCVFSPSTRWAQGGLLIEQECMRINAYGAASSHPKNPEYWAAAMWMKDEIVDGYGPTPLIAAMRCFVQSHFGDEVDVPEEMQ